jgi:beta-fructofuranosidase
MKKAILLFVFLCIPGFISGQSTYELFYKPPVGVAGDFIPFYENGEFKLFYLQDWRDKEKFGEGTAWYQISTTDFLHFTEHGEMIPRGTKEEQDLFVYTGSVIKAGNTYHIFYTGHNQYLRKAGKPEEAIMHAVSSDLIHWTKIPGDTFYSTNNKFEQNDWRDPFVFWNDEAKEYWMLVAARVKNNLPVERRGCTAVCTSKDLKKWKIIDEPFWQPGLYVTHECPDLFKIGDWWYLIYSIGNHRFGTQYIMSKSLKGPWITPDEDVFDSRAYYAAKSYSDGNKRYLFGWNSTKIEDRDSRGWEWGGNLVVHEIIQNQDGTLSLKVPESIDNAFNKELTTPLLPAQGKWKVNEKEAYCDATGSFASAISGQMPSCCKITSTVTFSKNTKECGLLLRYNEATGEYYSINLEPGRNRILFSQRSGYMETEKSIILKPDVPHKIKVFVDYNNLVVYVDDKISMSTRIYNIDDGKWGVFVEQGTATFSNTKIWTKDKN